MASDWWEKASIGSEHHSLLATNSQRRVEGEQTRNGEQKGEPMARRSRVHNFRARHGEQYTHEAS